MSNDTSQVYLPVHRIIPFSNVEGSGNRTSIFLQGCNLNCLYCHNPEMIPMKSNESNMVSIDELVDKIKNNMPFIRGVTISGGEATLHDKGIVELFKKVHDLGITCYIDTNGYFDIDLKREMVENTDKFLFDVKGYGSNMKHLCFDHENHSGKAKQEYEKDIKSDNYSNLDNLKTLLGMDKVEEVRLVYIKGFYDEYKIVDNLTNILKDYPNVLFKLIRMHLKGSRDAKSLARYMPSKEDVKKLEEYAKSKGLSNIFTINI